MLIIYIGRLTRAIPKFKSLRLAYRKTPPDQFAAAKSFRTLKVESIEASRHAWKWTGIYFLFGRNPLLLNMRYLSIFSCPKPIDL